MRDLAQLQRWMLDVVSHPEGIDAGVAAVAPGQPVDTALSEVIAGHPSMSRREQLRVYAYMFFERQQDVLDTELPTTRFLLGPERFRAITKAYLLAHPSTHHSLDHLGHALPDFIAARAETLPHGDLAACLARVERAMEELLDAPYDEPITDDALTRFTPDTWPTLRLRPIRAVRMLELSHPTRAFMDAHRDGRYLAAPDPAPTYAVVYRGSDDVIWRAEWARERFELFRALGEDVPLGAAIERVAMSTWCDRGLLATQLRTWFQRWTTDGLICGVEPA